MEAGRGVGAEGRMDFPVALPPTFRFPENGKGRHSSREFEWQSRISFVLQHSPPPPNKRKKSAIFHAQETKGELFVLKRGEMDSRGDAGNRVGYLNGRKAQSYFAPKRMLQPWSKFNDKSESKTIDWRANEQYP